MSLADELDELLAAADEDLAARYPGDRGGRQPVHTVYVPADRFTDDTVATYGETALAVLDDCAAALGSEAELVERVRAKLATEPVEDLRIDFEDGYGIRPDEIEDADVRRAAGVSRHAALAPQPPVPPTFGIRFKSFEKLTRARGVRTLELWRAEGGSGIVTLPKVTSAAQVEAMVVVCERLGIEGFEIQIETPQSVVLVNELVRAAQGRCTGLHYGTYDYSASLGIAAAYQSMEHPAADHAKAAMQLAVAGTGVFLSDGSTNVLPVGDHAADAWRLHARLVRRSLERGFYQGWDLHPAQLPSRYLATYAFFREGLPSAVVRLEAYRHGGSSRYRDEPATARALTGFLQRGLDCGAIDATEAAQVLEQ